MTADWASLVGKGSIRRFARSLRIALHDKKCEMNGSVLYCYDAVVAVRMVLGFEQFRIRNDRKRNDDPRNLLLRSLLSSGYLGQVTLLRPHALELHQFLARRESFHSAEARGAYRSRLKQFLDSQGVADLFTELVIGTIKKTDSDRIDHFLRQMQRIAPEAFVAIELANGSWQQRLTRLYKRQILRFEGNSTELREVLRDPLIWRFKDIIDSSFRRLNKGLSLVRLRDATAFAILHSIIRRFEAGEPVPQVRFFTEATFLREAWKKSPELVQLLSYSNRGGQEKLKDGELFIGREVDYFVLRAAFEVLRFPGVEARSEPAVTLEDLRQVSEELDALSSKELSELESYLNSRRLGQRLLAEHLDEFSSLAFLNSIWLTYEPPPLVRELVQGLDEVWKFGHEDEIEEALQQKIRQGAEEIQDTLRASVEEVDRWFETLDNVRDRVDKVIQNSPLRCEVPPNPERELGIARWGLELSSAGESRFKNFVRPLIGQDDQELHQGCTDLTTAILDVGGDLEGCVVVCSILWWLNGFKTLAWAIDRTEAELRKKGEGISVGLRIMRAAARLQNASGDLAKKEQTILGEVVHIDALPEDEKPRYYVGLSYLYYRAWSSETHDEKGEVTPQCRVFLERWIAESFLWAERAESVLAKDSLPWAFAVNNCAYIGAVAEIEPDKTDRYIRLLGDLERRYNLWNYRFADTLSYYYLLLAERKQNNHGEKEEICQLLKASAGYLAKALNCYSDPAIPAHRNRLIQLRSKIGCIDVEIPDL